MVKYPSYVSNITKCDYRKIPRTSYFFRSVLTGKLDNNYTANALFILMNPSHATENESDKTVNSCAYIAYHDLKHLKIGSFTVVNVHPYYEATSSDLYLILDDLNANHNNTHLMTMKSNSLAIERAIRTNQESNGCIFLCTGLIPKNITDKPLYEQTIMKVHDELEKATESVYLCKGDRNKNFFSVENLSYHLSPIGSHVNQAKKFNMKNRTFIDIPNEKPISLTHYKKK